MTNVAHIFDSKVESESALASLLSEGFTKDDISVLVSENAASSFFNTTSPVSQIANDTLDGATLGGSVGGILAGLAAVGTIIIPGINLLAVGPIAAILAGVGTGGLVGGLSAAISSEQQNEKEEYEKALKQGKTVMIVHAFNKDKEARARAVFNQYGVSRAA